MYFVNNGCQVLDFSVSEHFAVIQVEESSGEVRFYVYLFKDFPELYL